MFKEMKDYDIMVLYSSSDNKVKQQIQLYYYNKYIPALTNISLKYSNTLYSVDDNLQECFFGVCKGLNSIDITRIIHKENFVTWTWCKQAVFNTLSQSNKKYMTRRHLNNALSIDFKTEDQADLELPSRTDVESEFLFDENSKLVKRYLNTKVGPRIRDLFIGHIYENKPISVIAKERKCSKECIRLTMLKYKSDMRNYLINQKEFSYEVSA